jgi:Holliday junction resolvase-like predicted endonuclease
MTADFQRRAGEQGRSFEALVVFMLRAAGWTIISEKAKFEGVEIDITALEPVTGIEWWIECKGSWEGKTPGSKRGDTAKKAVGVAAYLSTFPDRKPYRLITSHLPSETTVPGRLLHVALEQGWFAAIDTVSFMGIPVDEGGGD